MTTACRYLGLMMHNELALRSKAEIDAGFARIWQVMHDGIERGMNTEGVLPGRSMCRVVP